MWLADQTRFFSGLIDVDLEMESHLVHFKMVQSHYIYLIRPLELNSQVLLWLVIEPIGSNYFRVAGNEQQFLTTLPLSGFDSVVDSVY
jgi:hypothetical protein